MNIQNFHILTVKFIGPTNTKPSRVKIISERFNDSVTIQYDHEFNGTLDNALDWCVNHGFDVVGKGEGKNHYYIMTSTFDSLTSHK